MGQTVATSRGTECVGRITPVSFDVIDVAVCPACRHHPLQRHTFREDEHGRPRDGVVSCPSCKRWYPVEDGLLELLVEELAYKEDRERFVRVHADALSAAGLEPDGSEVNGPGERTDEILHQQEHFDWYADNELQTYAEYERLPFWRAADAITFRRWRAQMRPGSRALDVGCAQGRSTFQFAAPDVDVIGFDISKQLVRQASERTAPGSRITFLVADATSMPFLPGSFDYALTYGVLHHLPDPARMCREIARVMRPNGVFFASENNQSPLRVAFELLQRLRPIWYEEAGEFAQISRQQLTDWLAGADLTVSTRTSVFLPPHLLNHTSPRVGARLLDLTDRIANVIPGLRTSGGLVVAEGVKAPHAL
jgi:ubiquinone/menaquinone biosynthesis C-methylase UbiE/uncharacterized protein YbaR (Trm112 family)